jgi:hypothetical protein
MKKILLTVLTVCGVMSARAAIADYSVTLDGPTEGNASPGVGSGSVIYDDVNHTLQLQVSFSGLSANTSASHIHAATSSPFSGTAGVATTTPSFVGFPLGVTSDTFSDTLDLTSTNSWNAAYITAHGGTPAGAELALATAMAAGEAYWNIHTTTFPGGEIRGFLVAVPEPSSVALLGLGAGALAWRMRRRS